MSTDSKSLTVTEWLVLTVAAIGFLFDTYELLMFPVIGAQAISELLNVAPNSPAVTEWTGKMLWIAALCGGIFGLLGGFFIDRFGRKRIMAASIFLYSFSPVAAAFSTSLNMLIFFRCTTFIGVCVEAVAAVTWLSELFADKRRRQLAIGWTLAFASLGGILVTEVYNLISASTTLPVLPLPEGLKGNAPWRFTLLTGLIPGALILLLLPFVPESKVWLEKKLAGTLRRPKIGELFAPNLLRTTIVTTLLSACGYAAAFGALQLTPPVMLPGLPEFAPKQKEINDENAAIAKAKKGVEKGSPAEKELIGRQKDVGKKQGEINKYRGNIQRWQELGGLMGRIVLAILLVVIASHRTLLRVFLVPGVFIVPITYLYLFHSDYVTFAAAIFVCGMVIVAQFSYFGEYLPKAFPLHLRGTGGSFAANVGGRMLGTMAAILNTKVLAPMFEGSQAQKVATAAAVIGGGAFVLALILSFFLPEPHQEAVD